jgi:hypothetical protein
MFIIGQQSPVCEVCCQTQLCQCPSLHSDCGKLATASFYICCWNEDISIFHPSWGLLCNMQVGSGICNSWDDYNNYDKHAMFQINCRGIVCVPSFLVTVIITIKLNGKCRFCVAATLFGILQKYDQRQSMIWFEDIFNDNQDISMSLPP